MRSYISDCVIWGDVGSNLPLASRVVGLNAADGVVVFGTQLASVYNLGYIVDIIDMFTYL